MASAAETKHILLRWQGDLRFTGGDPNGPAMEIDGDNVSAPGPMLTLFLAAASCSAADVVLILKKMRVELESLEVAGDGLRRPDDPKRYVSLHFTWTIRGTGLDEAKVRRAIDLSIEKYCSVMHSLAPDIAISYDLRLG